MFERFTDRARRVVVLAQEEARMMSHNYIGTEHLLLGLAAEDDGVGRKVLDQVGVTLASVRAEIERIIGRGRVDNVPEGHIPFTPRAKKTLELALRESVALGHNYIGTEHILLGLLREGEGVAAQILVRSTEGLGAVRSAVITMLAGYGPGKTAPAPTGSPSRWTPALVAAMETAVGRANTGSVGTHHVLSVFAEWDDTAAYSVLQAGGFDASRLERPIDEWDVADTRDETEQAWSERVTDIAASDEGVLIRILDEELRAGVIELLGSDDAEIRAILRRAVADLRRKLPPQADG
jgi:ATP-dependent Clp protease ATP-binding subunit ClpA